MRVNSHAEFAARCRKQKRLNERVFVCVMKETFKPHEKRAVNHSLTEKVRTGREKDSFSLL